MNNGKLVILAGGISSRMKNPMQVIPVIEEKLLRDADEKSKSMIGLGKDDRPFLDYLLFNAREAGYHEIVIVIGEADFFIKKYYGKNETDNNYKGLKISYAVQKIPAGRNKPLGTADALLCALKSKPQWKGKRFTVCNSDNLYSGKALSIMLNSKNKGALIDYDRSSLEFDQSRIEKFSVIIKNENDFLIKILEKPHSEKITELKMKNGYIGVSMNIFAFDYDVILPLLDQVPMHSIRKEKELPEAVNILADKYQSSVFTYPLAEHVPDLTAKTDIPEVKKYLERYYPDISF